MILLKYWGDYTHQQSNGQEIMQYDRLLKSWKEITGTEANMMVWFSHSLLSLLDEDKKLGNKNETCWNKIFANCLVLILALISTSEIDPCGGTEFSNLPEDQKKQCLNDLLHLFPKII